MDHIERIIENLYVPPPQDRENATHSKGQLENPSIHTAPPTITSPAF
jgi:hypothetical protein